MKVGRHTQLQEALGKYEIKCEHAFHTREMGRTSRNEDSDTAGGHIN